jgi:hypothetical protein
MPASTTSARASRATVVLSFTGLLSTVPGGTAFLDATLEAGEPSLVAAAERVGACAAGSSPAVPGTRFAFGTRFGRPAEVTPPDEGALTTSAARQPSSAGELQLSAFSSSCPEPATACRPRRNQSDSTDSKIGSRFSFPTDAAAGTTTPP